MGISIGAMTAEKIAPLQDVVDLKMATYDEAAELKKWKKFCVLINRVEQRVGFPDGVTCHAI